ncbi:MAG: hypothetical protein IJ758_03820, partial [Clostridia bacterium]|nr:hypothetical protein [Clostridia bacterium]
KAMEMLNAFIAEYENKELQAKTIEGTSQCNILFTDYMRNWLERKKNKIEITTWDGYYDVVNKALHFLL